MPDKRCGVVRAGWRGASSSCTRARARRGDPRGASAACTASRRARICPWVKARQWLAGGKRPVEARESVGAGIRQIELLDCEIAAVERLITRQALNWPEIRRLMTVPDVSLICAATFIAAAPTRTGS
jgi:transposase